MLKEIQARSLSSWLSLRAQDDQHKEAELGELKSLMSDDYFRVRSFKAKSFGFRAACHLLLASWATAHPERRAMPRRRDEADVFQAL